MTEKITYEFELPFPPTLNHYRLPVIRRTKTGKQYASFITSPEGKAYKSSIKSGINNPPRLEGELHVSLVFFPKTKAKLDIDNFLKALFDGLTEAGVWMDDSQVQSMYAEKGEVVKGGKVFIKISKK